MMLHDATLISQCDVNAMEIASRKTDEQIELRVSSCVHNAMRCVHRRERAEHIIYIQFNIRGQN